MKYLFLALAASSSLPAGADWLVQQRHDGAKIEILSVRPSQRVAASERQTVQSLPEFIDEGPRAGNQSSKALFEQVLVREGSLNAAEREAAAELKPQAPTTWAGSEVRTLVSQGPAANRINLTIVGDGYTAAEKDKFFADAQRITNDMFTGSTYASYLPLFNVYAVFVPSQQSGLTDGSNRRNTALGLYRSPAGSKRGVMPGNTSAIESALALAPATADFPILIANDDYYGGLGGRYAITTRSVESGTVVLRHELGHNFGGVGEEYDGGYVYSGANSSPTENVSWKHWAEGGGIKRFDGKQLRGDYLWESLSNGPIVSEFNFPADTSEGAYTLGTDISSVGWATPDDVGIFLNGQRMEYTGLFTRDRSFFKLPDGTKANPGKNTLEIRELKHDGDNVLAFANVYAYPPGYDFTPDRIAAFATYSDGGSFAGYRPTHESCLMRNMRTPKFCSVDLENMWVRFLSKIDLIDSVQVSGRQVTLKRPPLAGATVRWFSVGANGAESELTQLSGLESWTAAAGISGALRAKVSYRTPQVRAYTPRFESSKDFRL